MLVLLGAVTLEGKGLAATVLNTSVPEAATRAAVFVGGKAAGALALVGHWWCTATWTTGAWSRTHPRPP